MAWNPYGVLLEIAASAGAVTRISATQFTVKITAEWETYYNGAQTMYGMIASSGGGSVTLNPFGQKSSGSSGSFTGTYSISGNAGATKTISVTFRNYNDDNGDSATKSISLNVSVPAWTSYTVKYNANGGAGAPSSQTKWKNQTLTLSSAKPTRAGHSFQGWATSASGSVAYAAGANYTANAAVTLYAVWKANTYAVKYNANGGAGAPGSQTKTYGVTLTLSSTKPTRENHTFKGWATSASATTVSYAAGGSYTANAAITLYAVWELSYEKPKISSLKVSRCNSSGTPTDDGVYALISFNWSTFIAASAIDITWVDTTGTETGSAVVIDENGKPIETYTTSGTVEQVVGLGTFSPETSYSFTVTVTDSGGSTDRSVTMSGAEYHMDFGEHSVAIGKPAEPLTNAAGNVEKTFDVKWRSLFRSNVGIGDKRYYHDGKEGIFLSWEGFMHLQRTTAQGNHPYIGFYLDDATSATGMVRLNSNDKFMEFLRASGYHFDNGIYLDNDTTIWGYDTSGAACAVFQAKNPSNNTVIGYGNYTRASGNTNVYGHDINFGVANIANPGTYRPYRRQGDTATLTLRTAGYVTNGGKDISFWIPFSEPIVGSPTVTLTSGSGFVLRQGNAYTHGSTASVNVKPDSYEATATMFNGVYVKAVFSNTANVTNNDAIGIYWNGTITFS